MNVKPGIITQQEFNLTLVFAICIFLALMMGIVIGVRMERRALEEVLNDNNIQLIYPYEQGVIA